MNKYVYPIFLFKKCFLIYSFLKPPVWFLFFKLSLYPQNWSPRIYVHICNKPFISSCEYVMLRKFWESKKGFSNNMIYISCCLQSTFCTFFHFSSSLSLLSVMTFTRHCGTHCCNTGPSSRCYKREICSHHHDSFDHMILFSLPVNRMTNYVDVSIFRSPMDFVCSF